MTPPQVNFRTVEVRITKDDKTESINFSIYVNDILLRRMSGREVGVEQDFLNAVRDLLGDNRAFLSVEASFIDCGEDGLIPYNPQRFPGDPKAQPQST